MSPVSIELIVASAVGFVVLILTALFPALKDQFETMAPAIVAIILFVIGLIGGNALVKVWSANSIRRAELQAETDVRVAQAQAQSAGHSHG